MAPLRSSAATPALLTRRAALGRLAGLLAAGLAPAFLRGNTRAAAPFRFAVLNDLHHATPECDAWHERLFAAVQAERPEFVLALGDLAHTGLPASFATVARLADGLGVPFHTVPGNHDCDVEKTTALYTQQFPGQLNYSFAHAGWQFIGLDTTDGKKAKDTRIGGDTFAWLDENLPTLDRARPTVVFTHFPLAPGIGPNSRRVVTPLNASELLARFDGWNLRAGLSGHFHGPTEHTHATAQLATGPTCSRVVKNHDGPPPSPKGWRLCTSTPDGTFTSRFMPMPPGNRG